MESKVKSRISNKVYKATLDLEPDDRDIDSELYQVTIAGRNIQIAPGKTRMEEGIAYSYAYAIKQKKVVSKLGVYEKKTDTMPLLFDLSMFPEGSIGLFEEFERNPGKLVDLEISETSTIFDYLIPLFQKIEDKRKRLKLAYRNLHATYEREKKDKEIKPILSIISAASRDEEPKEDFLVMLKDSANDDKKFVLTMLALQYVFQIGFDLKTDDPELLDIMTRWNLGKVKTVIEIDVKTKEMIRERPFELMEEKQENEEPMEAPMEAPIEPPLPPMRQESLLKPLGPPTEPLGTTLDLIPEMMETRQPQGKRASLLEPIARPESFPIEEKDPDLIESETKPETKSETNPVTKPDAKPEKKTRIRRKVESVPFLGTSLNSVLPAGDLPSESVAVPKKEIKMKSKKK
jgi:hypothetical protein